MRSHKKALVAVLSVAVGVAGIAGNYSGRTFVDSFLDKLGIIAGEFEGTKALAGVKIFQLLDPARTERTR